MLAEPCVASVPDCVWSFSLATRPKPEWRALAHELPVLDYGACCDQSLRHLLARVEWRPSVRMSMTSGTQVCCVRKSTVRPWASAAVSVCR